MPKKFLAFCFLKTAWKVIVQNSALLKNISCVKCLALLWRANIWFTTHRFCEGRTTFWTISILLRVRVRSKNQSWMRSIMSLPFCYLHYKSFFQRAVRAFVKHTCLSLLWAFVLIFSLFFCSRHAKLFAPFSARQIAHTVFFCRISAAKTEISAKGLEVKRSNFLLSKKLQSVLLVKSWMRLTSIRPPYSSL